MKHYCLCTECSNNSWAIGEVQSDLIAVCKCPKGHVNISGLMHDLFDVLFSSGVQAYIKGFYSESIMSFTASLERAYELYIKLYMSKTGVSFDDIDSLWKELKNQSERQYGAFCTLYGIVEKESWKVDFKQVSFRNNVIHKGYIATSCEAKLYAEYVVDSLNKIIKSIKAEFAEQQIPLYFHSQKKSQTAAKKLLKYFPGAKFAATSKPSLLKWDHTNHEDASFEEAISLEIEINARYGFEI